MSAPFSAPDLNVLELKSAGREILAQQVAFLQQERLYLRRTVADAECTVADAERALVARIEGPRGIGLCDCDGTDSAPTSLTTGERMDHHCGCRAVVTAAILLGSYSATAHAGQCTHGTEMDEFYQRRSPAA